MKVLDDNVFIVISVTTDLIFVSVLEWYLLGFKSRFSHAQISLLQGTTVIQIYQRASLPP